MNPENQQDITQKATTQSGRSDTPSQEAASPQQQTTPIGSKPPIMDPLDFVPPTTPTSTRSITSEQNKQNIVIDQATASDRRKVKILGYSLIISFLITIIAPNIMAYRLSTLDSTIIYGPQLYSPNLSSLILLAIGIGLIKYKKIAMYSYIIYTILFVVGYIVFTVMFPWLLMILVPFVLLASFLIWGVTVLRSKRVRALFH